mgnify:CR=1 FL=1
MMSGTTTAPVDAYRGAGRPEATYVVERIVETAAREMKMDPAQIRRQNFITEFPYATPVGLTYDTGNYTAHLDKAIKIADVAGFPARKAASIRPASAVIASSPCTCCRYSRASTAASTGAITPMISR